MKKKRVFKTLAYTLLMIGTISTCYLTPTGAKYEKKSTDSEVLHYSSTFKKMNSEITQAKEELAKSHTLKYSFYFNRNQAINNKDKENDKYEISVSSGCEIEGITARNGNIENPNITSDKKVITYDNAEDDNIKVTLSCNVSRIESDGYLKFKMEVREFLNSTSKENPEKLEYLYLTADDENNYNATQYKLDHPYISETTGKRKEIDPTNKTASDIYQEFKTWINAYTNEAIGEQSIGYDDGYIEKYFTTETSINRENLESFNNSKYGMTAKFENNKYIFELDNNFTSYVKTYTNVSPVRKRFYFYNKDASIPNMFKEYIARHLYPLDSVEYIAVENYITKNNINTLEDFGKVPGIKYDAAGEYLEVANSLYNQLSMRVVKAPIDPNNPISNQIGDACGEMFDSYDEFFIYMTLNPFVKKYITKTSVVSGNEFFYSKVFQLGTSTNYIIVRVYSKAEDTIGYMDIEYIDNAATAQALLNNEITGDISLSDLDSIAPVISGYNPADGTTTTTIEKESYNILLTISSATGDTLNIKVEKVDKTNGISAYQLERDDEEASIDQSSEEEQQSFAEDSPPDKDKDTIDSSPPDDDSSTPNESGSDTQSSDGQSDTNPLSNGGMPIINDGGNIE